MAQGLSQLLLAQKPSDTRGDLYLRHQARKSLVWKLRGYPACDYDASLKLTIPMKLAPLPRLGDRSLLMGYNVVLGLREDNLDDMPKEVMIRLGRIRDKSKMKEHEKK
ncbi:TPA: type VI secretion system baseplate subunit TssG [Yersinia enterocolitica]